MERDDFKTIPVRYDGSKERRVDALNSAAAQAVLAGRRPAQMGINPRALDAIRKAVGAPRIETVGDGTYRVWTPVHQLRTRTSEGIPFEECRLYDHEGRLIAEIRFGELPDATPATHGQLE